MLTIIILLIAQTFTIFIVVSINSLPDILSNFKFPSGPSNLNIDIYNPEDMTLEIPYEIINPTIFDISDIGVIINISIEYTRQSDRANISSYIFGKSDILGISKAFHSLTGTFEGDFNCFNITALITYFNEFDPSKLVFFYLHLNIDIKYFFRLMHLNFKIYNILLI